MAVLLFSIPLLTLSVGAKAQIVELEEVVVTAQKRTQSIQDVPLAVTAMSADQLLEAGIFSVTDLTDFNPSLSFDNGQSSQNSSLKIRGIGTFGNGRGFEGAVGTYVDGVYRSRSGMVLGEILDIGRLEVLRGPQGSLFGKNTVAGAVTLESAAPNFEEVEGYVEARAGNEGELYFTGAVNTPLSRNAALRLSGVYHERDGFYETSVGEDQDNIDRYALKANFLIEPSDALKIQFIVDYQKSDAQCCYGAVYTDAGPTIGAIGPILAEANGLRFTDNGEDSRNNDLNRESRDVTEDWGAALRVNWDLNDTWSLTSISGYREFDQSQTDSDADFGPIDLLYFNDPTSIKNFSQEFNLVGVLGNTDVVAGLYYASEDYRGAREVFYGTQVDEVLNILASEMSGINCLPTAGILPCALPEGLLVPNPDGITEFQLYEQDSESYAAFFHTTTPITDNFSLVLGVRYGVEDKDGGFTLLAVDDNPITATLNDTLLGLPAGTTQGPFNAFNLLGVPVSTAFQDQTRDTEWVGTASLQYFLGSGANVYLTYSRGFKAGGVNLDATAATISNRTYDTESADSFELGGKFEYWGGRARTNVALFHTEFDDLQVNFFTGVAFRVINADKAISKGLEVENMVQISSNWRATLDMTFLDASYGDVAEPQISYLSDRDTPRAPGFAGTLALNYEKAFDNGFEFYGRGSAAYTGSHFTGADVADEQKVSGYTIYNATIGFRRTDEAWGVSLFCDNCTDETYRTIFFNSPVQPESFSTKLNVPRTFGISVRSVF